MTTEPEPTMRERTLAMEKCIAALVFELPGEVWEDVRDHWHAVRDRLDTQAATIQGRIRTAFEVKVDPVETRESAEWVTAGFPW